MSRYNPKNINEARTYLNRSILLTFFIFLLTIMILWAVVFVKYSLNKQTLLKDQLNTNIQLYKTNLSEKLSIIANSPIFVNYLRSGPVSRKDLHPHFLREILTLKAPSITGMKIDYSPSKYLSDIENNQPQTLFSQGKPSPYSITLPICYLNNQINFKYGVCEHNWTLYFSKQPLIQALKKINPHIAECHGNFCAISNLLGGAHLGSFPIRAATSLPSTLKIVEPQSDLLYFVIFITLSALSILIIVIKNKTKNIVNSTFALPIKNIIQTLKKGGVPKTQGYIKELAFLNNQFKIYHEEKDKIEIANIASQAAHDIRSPLAALTTVLKDLPEISEQKRILIRNATHRMSDIANNLLVKYKIQGKTEAKMAATEAMKPELAASLLDALMAEKKLQVIDKPIELQLAISDEAHGAFIAVEPNQFKRVISNLINNSIEAIQKTGYIKVSVTIRDHHTVVIQVTDNGKGIPKNLLPKIRAGIGGSHGKANGYGLGLSGAIDNIKKWKGRYEIHSTLHQGTIFTIQLPIAPIPLWFQHHLLINPHQHIVVLDDDESIHNIWEMHFKKLSHDLHLIHFYKPSELTEYSTQLKQKDNYLFLIDYELIGFNETGLDLIEKCQLNHHAILVTSRYEEQSIRNRAEQLKTKIIPKNYAPYLPIELKQSDIHSPDLIFIDDDIDLTAAWEQSALLSDKTIVTFNNIKAARKRLKHFSKNTPIYIDSNLGEETPGELFAKELFEIGFKRLYLATGFDKNKFSDCPWLTDIVSKEPPFQ